MSSSDNKKSGFGNPIVNLLLTGLVFLFWLWLLRPYVPAQTELFKWLFSTFPAIALTVTFYFSLNMYLVTVNDHKARKSR